MTKRIGLVRKKDVGSGSQGQLNEERVSLFIRLWWACTGGGSKRAGQNRVASTQPVRHRVTEESW